MFTTSLRTAGVLILVCLSSHALMAQQDTGDVAGQLGGQTAAGGTGAAATAIGTLDADTAFENVERGSTVGATSETGTGFSDLSVGNAGAGGAGGLGGLGGFGGGIGGLRALGNLFGGVGAGTQSSKPAIRTRIRSAVSVTPVPPARVQQLANLRFRSVSTRPQLRGINVTMQGQTAVLRGVVNSDRDRRMSEMLIRLEPGVRSVDNQVTVRP